MEYKDNPEKLGVYMCELVEKKLVKPIVPLFPIGREAPKFKDSFLDLIDNNEQILRKRGVTLTPENTKSIHIEKLQDLDIELVKRGLAKELDYPWLEVEAITADFFMGYLATVLGKCESIQMDPITDKIESLSVFSSSPHRILGAPALLEELRLGVLESILPAPTEDIVVDDFVGFKKRHSRKLSRFRRHIENELIKVALIKDEAMREYRFRLFKEELVDDLEDVMSTLKNQWVNILPGTLCTFIPAAIPVVEAALSQDLFRALQALPSLISAALRALGDVKSLLRSNIESPLAYAALAQREFA